MGLAAHLRLGAFAAAALLASNSARAFELGVGLEGGGTLSISQRISGSGHTTTGGGLGLILEERFKPARPIELTVWEDVQLPYTFTVASVTPILEDDNTFPSPTTFYTATYVPIDLGLRLGLGFSRFRPYVGIFLNDSVPTSSAAYSSGNFVGLGGNLGLDVLVLFLRFGLDLRAFSSITAVNDLPNPVPGATLVGGVIITGSVMVFQGLLSARAEF